jgi:hypothetical protein
MFRFSIRDVLYLTVVVAVALGGLRLLQWRIEERLRMMRADVAESQEARTERSNPPAPAQN